MAVAGSVTVKIGGNLTEFQQSLSRVVRLTQQTAQKLRSVGRTMTIGVTVPILGAAAAAIKFASDVQESQSKASAVFKEQARDIEEWAAMHAASIGRSRFDLQNYAADVQDTFVPLGFARDEAAKMSKAVVELAEDLASFKNLRTEEVVRGLTSALVGNVENLRQFGVVANEAQIKQQALKDGIIRTTKDALTPQQKALAIWRLTLAGTTDAQGDALRTVGAFANRMRGLQARFKDVAVELGQRLLPLATRLVAWASNALGWFQRLNPEVKTMGLLFLGIAAAIGPVVLALGLLLTPIGLTIAGVAALGTAAVLLVQNWDVVQKWWKLFWDNMAAITKAGTGLVAKFMIDQFAQMANVIADDFSIFGVDLLPSIRSAADKLKAEADDLVSALGGPEASGRMKQMQALIDDLSESADNFTFEGMIGGLEALATKAGQALKGFIQPLIDALKEMQTLADAGTGVAGFPKARVGLGQPGQPGDLSLSGLGVGAAVPGFAFDTSGLQATLDLFNSRMRTTGEISRDFGREMGAIASFQLSNFAGSVGYAASRVIVFGDSLADTLKNLGQRAAGGLFSAALGLGLSFIPGIGPLLGAGAGKALGGVDFGTAIPGFAGGGVVTRPTIAMIGEAGPEAIVPLSRAGALGGVAVPASMTFHVGSIGDLVIEIDRYRIANGIEMDQA